MYEVFDYITGETVGFTDDWAEAKRRAASSPRLDWINADHESGDFNPFK